MKEIKTSPDLERMIEYARFVTGEEKAFTAAAYLVAVIDVLTGRFEIGDDEIADYANAFLPYRKIDITEMRKRLIENISHSDTTEKYDEVYIRTFIQDAELMAEKAGRDTVIPKDLFMAIILRPDRVSAECMRDTCSDEDGLY